MLMTLPLELTLKPTEDKKDLPEQQTVFGAVTYMTKPGFKVDSKGKVTNKNTGETMPLSEALVKGVVFSHSTDDAGKLVWTTLPFGLTLKPGLVVNVALLCCPDDNGPLVKLTSSLLSVLWLNTMPLANASGNDILLPFDVLTTFPSEIKFDTVVPGSTTFIAKPGFKLDTDGKVVNTSNGSKMSLPEAYQIQFVALVNPSCPRCFE
jgi:hypothetical protein